MNRTGHLSWPQLDYGTGTTIDYVITTIGFHLIYSSAAVHRVGSDSCLDAVDIIFSFVEVGTFATIKIQITGERPVASTSSFSHHDRIGSIKTRKVLYRSCSLATYSPVILRNEWLRITRLAVCKKFARSGHSLARLTPKQLRGATFKPSESLPTTKTIAVQKALHRDYKLEEHLKPCQLYKQKITH